MHVMHKHYRTGRDNPKSRVVKTDAGTTDGNHPPSQKIPYKLSLDWILDSCASFFKLELLGTLNDVILALLKELSGLFVKLPSRQPSSR